MAELSRPASVINPPSPQWPLFIWMAAQVGTLLLAALRVPLWAHAPETGEILAVSLLLIVQIGISALLSPLLAFNWQTTVMAAATCWPFATLAGLLATTSAATITLAEGYVTTWLVVLWAWNQLLESPKSKMTAAAIAATWAMAGPFLIFIRIEYNLAPIPVPAPVTRLAGPLIDGLSVIDPRAQHSLSPWETLIILAVIAGGAKWGRRVMTAARTRISPKNA